MVKVKHFWNITATTEMVSNRVVNIRETSGIHELRVQNVITLFAKSRRGKFPRK